MQNIKASLWIVIVFFCLCETSRADLLIWTSSENVAKALKKLTPQFQKDFKHRVEVTVLNKDLTTQFKTAAIAGKGPDILCWANDVIGELASSGLVEPLLLSKDLKKNFYSSAINSFTYKGKLYGYPYDVEALALIRNTHLSPVPISSFEELQSFSKNYKNIDSLPFLFDIKNFYFNFMFLSAGGGYIFNEVEKTLQTDQLGLANNGAVSGVKFLHHLVNEGIIPTSSNRNIAFEKMLKGKLAFTIDGPWAVNDLKKSGIPFSIDPLPTLKGMTPRPLVGTHGFIIRRSSTKKELAKELIEKYFVTAEGLATLYEEDPRGPSRADTLEILKEKLPKADLEYLTAFSKSVESGIPMPNVSAMGPVWSSMGTALELVLQKNEDVEITLTKAQQRILDAINRTKKQEKL